LTGDTTLRITVTPEEGNAITYTVEVAVSVQLSDDATLSSLTVSVGALSPAFATNTLAYTVEVENSVDSITLTATAATGATAVGDGVKALIVGENSFTITVTAEDGTTNQGYTVIVTREAAKTGVSTVASALLRLYPNPVADGTLRIENGNLKAGEKILIYGLSGVLVATYEVSAGAVTVINVSQLPQGVYIVKAGAYAAKVSVY
jgi:hypothetical protein